jgi:hypothetical protein
MAQQTSLFEGEKELYMVKYPKDPQAKGSIVKIPNVK